MKSTKIIFLSLSLFIAFLFLSNVGAVNITSSSNGYNAPIISDSFIFNAELLDNGSVKTSWNAYNKDEKLKYYKLVRSSNNSNPVYPDDGYIKYSADVNFTSYIDTSAPAGVNFYRICAITQENNRYCSNVVKIYIETVKKENTPSCTLEYNLVCGEKNGYKKTYSNKCLLNSDLAKYLYKGECGKEAEKKEEIKTINHTSNNLNTSIKYKSEKIAKEFILKVENKYSTKEKKLEVLKNVVFRLEILAKNNSKLKEVVSYIINILQEKINSYDDGFSDIESILNDY